MKADEDMNCYSGEQWLMAGLIVLRELRIVLSGFAPHLALHFGRSSSNHSYRYAFSNDHPNCFASCTANSGSFMKYAG
jgi:hypothetical protein